MGVNEAPAEVGLATTLDLPALLDLMEGFHEEAGYRLDRDGASEGLKTILEDPGLGAVWICRSGGEPVGFVTLTSRFAMEHPGLEGYIDDLYVRPDARRSGVASSALDSLVEECRRRRIKALHVQVDAANAPALALYARFGLVPPPDGRVTLSTRLESSHSGGGL
jgi:ribosomal protein S18 acetylase RimI-like enzyme